VYCTNPGCPDLIATGAPAEYVDGITVCPVCGASLAEGPEVAEGVEASDDRSVDGDVEVEPVFETSDPTEVEIVKSILVGAEIPFLIDGMERFSTFVGSRSALRFNPNAGSVTVIVPSDRAEEARALLVEVEPDTTVDDV